MNLQNSALPLPAKKRKVKWSWWIKTGAVIGNIAVK